MAVYSCSQFFNELDTLELRLETLAPVVDHFVISESAWTHSGKPKDLNYLSNIYRYEKFWPKIIHQVVQTPSGYDEMNRDVPEWKQNVVNKMNSFTHFDRNQESYFRDSYEKEALFFALKDCKDDDIILLSDLDEIVRPEALQYVLRDFDYSQIYHFQHDMFYYSYNLQKDEPWYGTMAMSYEMFKQIPFCHARQNKTGLFVSNGGHHFTYAGDANANRTKIESWGEQSLNKDWVKNNLESSINNCIFMGRDLFGRPCKFTIRDVNDGTFPPYLVEHQNDIFAKYIRKA